MQSEVERLLKAEHQQRRLAAPDISADDTKAKVRIPNAGDQSTSLAFSLTPL
jgi:hypothetical protein